MQFDEKDLDKDDNNFTLPEEDSNTISWEDLLNSEDEVDLDSLIKNDEPKATPVEPAADEADDFDLSSVVDTGTDENVQEKQEEAAFDINSAANEYVNSLEPEIGAPKDNISETKEIKEEKVETSGANTDSSDNTPLSFEDDVFLDDELKENVDIPTNADLSSVVDDELLGLLDADEDKTNEETFLQDNSYEVNDGTAAEIVQEPYKEEKQETEIPETRQSSSYTSKVSEPVEEEYPSVPETKKKKTPVVAFVIIGLIGLFAVIFYFVWAFFGGNSSVADDVPLSPDYTYSSDNPVNDDIQADKEALELVNKVETKKAKKDDKNGSKEKVVVAVPVGGRINPFVPSSLFDEAGFANFGSDLSLPPDVDINSPEVAQARKLLSISVSGIMYDQNRPSAILKFDNQDYFVQKGDRIDTYTVKTITKEYVAIQNGANIYKAYVGETFKTNEIIPAQNEVRTNNGTRQYISSSDIEISTK